jgi:hypothetical protein
MRMDGPNLLRQPHTSHSQDPQTRARGVWVELDLAHENVKQRPGPPALRSPMRSVGNENVITSADRHRLPARPVCCNYPVRDGSPNPDDSIGSTSTGSTARVRLFFAAEPRQRRGEFGNSEERKMIDFEHDMGRPEVSHMGLRTTKGGSLSMDMSIGGSTDPPG